MLQDVFVEHTVKRREIITLKPLYYISMVFLVICFLLGIIFPLFFAPGVMFLFMMLWIRSLMDLEFDYTYTNGELEIAKVKGSVKRKELVNIASSEIVVMAPSHTAPVKSYIGRRMKTYDCTSHDAGMKYYVLIFKKNGREMKLIFQPNEEIIDRMKRANTRIVYRDGEV